MFARIYKPSRTAMQSGQAKTHEWHLEFERGSRGQIDPLTGTYRSTDMKSQVSLKFPTLEEAVAYAKENNIPHRVEKPKTVKRVHRSYSDNFAYDRKLPWTH